MPSSPHPEDDLTSPSASSKTSTNGLRIYYQNVRGLRTKIDDFFVAVVEAEYDVLVLTETWLDDRIHSAQLFGNRFTVFRNDRSPLNSTKARGGGVLIAVATRLCCCLDSTPVDTSVEHLWVKVKMVNRSISIGAIYLPPDRKSDLVCIDNHINSISAVLSRLDNHDLALLFGDYNQSGLVWDVQSGVPPTIDVLRSHMPVPCYSLLDGFDLHGLAQINNVLNRNARLLDLLLVNEAALSVCTVSEAPDPLIGLDADHPALETLVNISAPILYDDVTDPQALDFNRADFVSLSHALTHVDWQYLASCSTVDEAVDYFTQTLSQAIAAYVPIRRPPSKPVWGNARLRHLKRVRSQALRRYSKTRNVFTKRYFSLASNDYRTYNRYLYKRYARRMQNRLRRNPKSFWAFVRSKRNEEGLPTEIYLGDRCASSPQDKSNLLAEHFKGVFNSDTATMTQVRTALSDTPSDVFDFNNFTVSPEMVESAINKLKYSSVGGPDGIPTCVLKRCSAELILPLSIIFNFSLRNSVFPELWKFSFMFPVHKKGDKQNVQNYRGITSLSACSKVFELIVNDALFSCCKNYISSDQHGFYPRRSISTSLVPFTSLCLRNMEKGAQVDCIYTDLKAAFDRVDHSILLAKLGKLGVSSHLVDWFRSYLTNRKLCVKLGAAHSEYFANKSGVPQGSNLGPLLFSIFLNDVGFALPSGIRVFYADDVKIFAVVRSSTDCVQLQQWIDAFSDWCSRNYVTISVQKCNAISFHRKQTPILYDYSICNQPLHRVEVIRDLGIMLDSTLSFKVHYSDIIAKANKQLGFICKITKEFRDPLCLKALYCSLVRSILEFGSVVWCPYQRTWIMRLESIQRKFVRFALRYLPWNDPQNLPPYEHRCQLLGIDTLEHRRSTAQALFTAKVLIGEIDSPEIIAEIQMYAPERPLRGRNFLHLPARAANYGLHDPIRYMCARFNEYYILFDFNITTNTFRVRIGRMLREENRIGEF